MNILNKIRSLSSKAKLAVAVAVVGIAVAPFAVSAGFFPADRPTFDYNKGSDSSNCNDPNDPGAQNGRCGSLNGPVFNSFVNTPGYGDERAFFDGRRADQPGVAYDVVTDVTEGTKEVVLRMYVHNNANQTTNASGLGVAKNTRVSVELPTNTGSALRAVASITADNATPREVVDSVDMTASRPFNVQFVPGSATFYNNGPFAGGVQLSDSIVSGGTQIGWDSLNGNLPGCFEYEGVVELRLKITPEQSNELQLVKEVRKAGETDWKREVQTKPGDRVQWLLSTKNLGLDTIDEVAVRDVLPPHVSLVNGSVRVIDENGDRVQADAPVFSNGGIGLGTYNSGGGRYVIFDTTVSGDFEECQKRVRNIALARSKQTPTEVRDTADVVITREDCDEDITPEYSCDSLTAEKIGGRKIRFTANASAINGATIQRYIFNYGDGSEEFVTDQRVVEHTYARDGQYATRLKVQIAVDNETFIVDGNQCATSITFTTPGTPTTPVSTTPGKLPETGAGSAVLTFLAVTTASTMAYYYVVARRSVA